MNEKISYAAIYHLVNDETTECDDISAQIANKIAPVIAQVMGVTYKVLTRKSTNDRNKDGFLNDNYYGVLHGARLVNTPGLILEHGFHTNTNTTKWLLSDANLDRLAKAEAECINAYFCGSVKPESEVKPTTPISFTPYKIRVSINNLNIRKGPGTNYGKNGVIDPGVYTIVEEKTGKGSKSGWGKLKTEGVGWISLDYVTKL